MGREKFRITTAFDSEIMHLYLRSHKEVIRNEFSNSKDMGTDDHKNLIDCLDIYTELNDKSIYNVDVYRSAQTTFLYRLSEQRRNKIRTTIRSRRMSSHNDKKQLTINIDVHTKLKKYAKEHNQTLSEAIKCLLDNYQSVN